MAMAVDDLVYQRTHSPAWRLLRAESAPYVAAFLHDIFVAGNRRDIPERELIDLLDDFIYRVRQGEPTAMARPPREYLRQWADVEHFGWLRSAYPEGADEPHYDITPAAERALSWLETLTERSFIGTESRLLTLIELLRSMMEGTETDPLERIRVLEARRAELDAEIERIQAGDIRVMDETAVRDRFQQFEIGAVDLLRDFRAVEDNFRNLDRGVRERIAGWQGARGELLDSVFTERASISESDQGRSFRAFWDLLMSSERQDELTTLISDVLSLPAINSPGSQLRGILTEWLVAGEAVQRTVAQLSKQMRRFLDTQAYLDNRRIAEIIHDIEATALDLRDDPPSGTITDITESRAEISLPMMRTMYLPTRDTHLDSDSVTTGDADFTTGDLFSQIAIDVRMLRRTVDRVLAERDQVTLADVVDYQPLELGLAELTGYLKVADDDPAAVIDDTRRQRISWEADGVQRCADVPMVLFTRNDTGGSRG